MWCPVFVLYTRTTWFISWLGTIHTQCGLIYVKKEGGEPVLQRMLEQACAAIGVDEMKSTIIIQGRVWVVLQGRSLEIELYLGTNAGCSSTGTRMGGNSLIENLGK